MKESTKYLDINAEVTEISETYIQPFMHELDKLNLSFRDVQDTLMDTKRIFSLAVNYNWQVKQDTFLTDIYNLAENVDPPGSFVRMLRMLTKNKALCAMYFKLYTFYTIGGKNIVDKIFNEMIFPLSELKPGKIDSARIFLQKEKIISSLLYDERISAIAGDKSNSKKSSIEEVKSLTNLPIALQQHINGFFQNDISTIINYRTASKHTYGLQKITQDTSKNILYAAVNIYIKPKQEQAYLAYLDMDGDFCQYIINDKLFGSSIDCEDQTLTDSQLSRDKMIKLFPSRDDAKYYARYYLSDRYSKCIPRVMMVSYIGDRNSLIFKNNMSMPSADVPAKAVLPIAAMCLINESAYNISRRIFRKLFIFNYPKVPAAIDNLSVAERVYIKIHTDLQGMEIKSNKLAARGFITEGRKLKDCKYSLVEQLASFEKNFLNISVKEREDAIKQFKYIYNMLFEKNIIDLNHSRNDHHVMLEVFLSGITCGIYIMAMIINKIVNKHFSFFRPDTVNKLYTVKQDLDNYMELVEHNLAP